MSPWDPLQDIQITGRLCEFLESCVLSLHINYNYNYPHILLITNLHMYKLLCFTHIVFFTYTIYVTVHLICLPKLVMCIV